MNHANYLDLRRLSINSRLICYKKGSVCRTKQIFQYKNSRTLLIICVLSWIEFKREEWLQKALEIGIYFYNQN